MKLDMNDPIVVLAKTRMKLLLDYPFFGTISLKLKLTPTHILPTLATDGVRLLFNPEYVMQYARQPGTMIALVMHEALHCMLGHPWRFASTVPEKKEDGTDLTAEEKSKVMRRLIATDCSINPMIREAGRNRSPKLELPEGCVYPAMWKLPENMSAEWYYNHLPTDPDELMEPLGGNGGEGHGPGQCNGDCQSAEEGDGGCGTPHHCSGVFRPTALEEGEHNGQPGQGQGEEYTGKGDALQPSDLNKLQEEWKRTVKQAAQAAKGAGRLPAGFEIYVDEATDPVIPWQEKLRRFMTEKSRADYRMFPPNRKHIHRGLYLPSIKSDDVMGNMVVLIDASGSTQEYLSEFLSETLSLAEEVRPNELHVISFDGVPQTHQVFTPQDYPLTPEMVEIKGGGGTNFLPNFDYIEEEDINPVLCVVLTDMYPCDGWPQEGQYPIMWVSCTDVEAPEGSGETIFMEGKG